MRGISEEYGVEGLSSCPVSEEEQVFFADYAIPEEFCSEAWKAVYQYVFVLAHQTGEELFYYNDWIRKSGIVICVCNDDI